MRSFILGTDWGEDCDDAVCVRVLARSHKAGKINFIGAGINTYTEYAAPSLYKFLEMENCIIPIGVDKNCSKTDWQNRYQPRLAGMTDKRDSDFEDAVRVYRRLIAEAEGKVEIVEVGFLQVLADTLLSQGDDISPLTGMELFEKKVDKVWIMGGKWCEQGGKEFNFSYTPFACRASATVLEKCPCEITLLGWEVGAGVITGNTLSKDDYLYRVLADHGCPDGRESWDPMTAILAVIGDEEKAGYDAIPISARIDPNTGANYFAPDNQSKIKYVVKREPDSFYTEMINKIIQ